MTLILLENLLFVTSLASLVWLISLKLKDSSIVDIFWGSGFAFLALKIFFNLKETHLVHQYILVLIVLWGLRLSTYLFFRNKGGRRLSL